MVSARGAWEACGPRGRDGEGQTDDDEPSRPCQILWLSFTCDLVLGFGILRQSPHWPVTVFLGTGYCQSRKPLELEPEEIKIGVVVRRPLAVVTGD